MPTATSRSNAPRKAASATSVTSAASEMPAQKASTKARGKPGGKVPAAPKRAAAKPAPAVQPATARKPVRLKLVRDSFTMPKPDFELIEVLKQRALKLGREVKKSELLRAGLHALAGQGDAALISAIQAVPRLKTGRPHKKGK